MVAPVTAPVTAPVIRVPASSANLGAGFDVFGMALSMYGDVGAGDPPDGARALDEHHPATIAFARLGGTGPIWMRSSIPMGRGLGFSGVARVGGAALAAVLGADDPRDALAARRDDVWEVAADLEGHADNVTASLYGGIVASVGGPTDGHSGHENGRILRLRVGATLVAAAVVLWIPSSTTSTDRSRAGLGEQVPRPDAVHNLGRVVQFALAVERDDPALLPGSTDDRLHQPARLASVPDAADALDAGTAAGAWCGWLSGSGPTVALLCDAAVADTVEAALPATGHRRQVRIDTTGAHPL